MLKHEPDDFTKEEFEAAISIVIVTWNAVVMDAWNKTDKFERELMARLEEGPKQAKIEVKRLIKRKKTKFSTDLRAVGNHWVNEQDGEYIFGCEARGKVENFVSSTSNRQFLADCKGSRKGIIYIP